MKFLIFTLFLSFAAYPCTNMKNHLGKHKLHLSETFSTNKKTLFEWLSKTPNVAQWLGNFKSHQMSSDPKNPYGVGHIRKVEAPFVGITEETITLSHSPDHIQYKVTKSKLMDTHLGDMCLSSLGPKKTLLKWTISFNSNYFYAKFVHLYLKLMLKRLKYNLPASK